MNQKIIDWTKRVKDAYPHDDGRVLDVGSLNVNGSVKHLFPLAKEYIGIDFREGPDVDIVLNGHDLTKQFSIYSFDNVVCMNMLEHDDKFWKTLEQMNMMLDTGGMLYLAWPGIDFPVHDYPGDYWRVTEQAMAEIILKGYEVLNIETIYTKTNDAGKPINGVVCALGRKL